jgi:hypothetical protein
MFNVQVLLVLTDGFLKETLGYLASQKELSEVIADMRAGYVQDKGVVEE